MTFVLFEAGDAHAGGYTVGKVAGKYTQRKAVRLRGVTRESRDPEDRGL
jgi:hypothetical protein